MQIEQIHLEGKYVVLEPLEKAHSAALADAIADGELHANPYTFIPRASQLDEYLDRADLGYAEGRELPFAIVHRQLRRVVGSIRFCDIVPQHRRVQIGRAFVARSWQRTYVNTETRYLMLRYAFDVWHCNRVEFLADVLNVQSRAALERIGARLEGILRSHLVMPDKRVADCALYSITAGEWEGVCAELERKLMSYS